MSRLVVGTNYNDSVPITNKGNYYIEKTKYGLTVDGYIGNIDQNNQLQLPSFEGTPNFSKVKGFCRKGQFEYKFMNQQHITGTAIFGITNPNFSNTMRYCFANSSITGFSLPNIIRLTEDNTFESVCQLCSQLTTFSIPNLEEITECSKPFYRSCRSCSSLETVNFQSLVTINSSQAFDEAFYGCGNLRNLIFDSLETLSGYRAFYRIGYQSGIETLSFPSLETIQGNGVMMDGFFRCNSLETIYMPHLRVVSGNQALAEAFHECPNLVNISLPNLGRVEGDNAMNETFSNNNIETVDLSGLVGVHGSQTFDSIFRDNIYLNQINFNELTTIEGNNVFTSAFQGDTSLITIDFRNLDRISGNLAFSYTFAGSGLEYLEFPALFTIEGQNTFSHTFDNCQSLEYVIFRGEELTIKNQTATTETQSTFTSAFNGCSSMTELMFSSKIDFTNCATAGVFYHMLDGCTSLTDIWFDNLTIAGLGTLRNSYFQNMLNINDSRYSSMNPIRFHINRQVQSAFRNGRTDAEIITSMGLPSGSSIVWGYKYITTASQATADTRYDRDPTKNTLTSLAWTKIVSGVSTTVYTKKIYQRTGTTSNCDGEPWGQHDAYYSDPECTNLLGYVYSCGA